MHYEKDLQALKKSNNQMISTMEKATSVTIAESDYWKAVIELNRNQNRQLSLIAEEQVNEELIDQYSVQIFYQLSKEISEQTDTIQDLLDKQQRELSKQVGKVNESMLSASNNLSQDMKQIKKKLLPLLIGIPTAIQVLLTTVCILSVMFLK